METHYDTDFQVWLHDQAEKLRARAHNEIDWDNLAEEIESVGRSERRELRSRLVLLIQHLLKWQVQPGRRSESWLITISEQRIWIPGIVETSPGLQAFPSQIFAEAYAEGRQRAIDKTGLLAKVMPVDPPFTVEQALDSAYFPCSPIDELTPFETDKEPVSRTPRSATPMSKPCECGCGTETRGGDFLPGHDQKLRAELERRIGGLMKLRDLVETALGQKVVCSPK